MVCLGVNIQRTNDEESNKSQINPKKSNKIYTIYTRTVKKRPIYHNDKWWDPYLNYLKYQNFNLYQQNRIYFCIKFVMWVNIFICINIDKKREKGKKEEKGDKAKEMAI